MMTYTVSRRGFIATTGAASTALLWPAGVQAQQAAINYWHTFTSQTEFAGLEAVMAMFATAHPDIALTQENIPNPEYMAKMTAAVIAKARPDVAMVSSERFTDLAAMGALIDLTDRLDGWERRAEFDPSRFASITDAKGRIYGLPAFAFVDWMYYRKDWFDAAGLAAPATFDDLRTAALALTDPAAGRFGFGMRGGPGGQSHIINVIESFGSTIVNAAGIGLDRDKAIAAIEWYAGLLTKDAVVPASAANSCWSTMMLSYSGSFRSMVWTAPPLGSTCRSPWRFPPTRAATAGLPRASQDSRQVFGKRNNAGAHVRGPRTSNRPSIWLAPVSRSCPKLVTFLPNRKKSCARATPTSPGFTFPVETCQRWARAL